VGIGKKTRSVRWQFSETKKDERGRKIAVDRLFSPNERF